MMDVDKLPSSNTHASKGAPPSVTVYSDLSILTRTSEMMKILICT